jgi:hypothetical protein
MPVRREGVRALIAAVPVPFQGKPLPAVVKEVNAAKAVIPLSSILPMSSNQDPAMGLTASMVLDALPEATVFHLASHGKQVSPPKALQLKVNELLVESRECAQKRLLNER